MLKYKLRFLIFRIFRKSIQFLFILIGKKYTSEDSKYLLLDWIAFFKKFYVYNQGQLRFRYIINNDIGFLLFFKGSFEENELSICRTFLKRDSVIFDIGANIGIHSIYFSQLNPDGCTYCFEPSRLTFELLNHNLKNSANTVPINSGIGSNSEILNFYETSDNAFSSFKDTKRKTIHSISKVLCLKLDDFVKLLDIKKIDFIKIDVEGFEQEVIDGMFSILKNYRPVVFCEIYKGVNSNLDPSKTISTICGFNYTPFIIKEKKLIKYEVHSDFYPNYIFIPE